MAAGEAADTRHSMVEGGRHGIEWRLSVASMRLLHARVRSNDTGPMAVAVRAIADAWRDAAGSSGLASGRNRSKARSVIWAEPARPVWK